MIVPHLNMEPILGTDIIMTAFNRDRLGMSRIVDLACGHKAITRALDRCICRRCEEMHKRSCATGEEDWVAFRHGSASDYMVWEDDPVRGLNER